MLILCSIVKPFKSDYVCAAFKEISSRPIVVCYTKKSKYQQYIHKSDIFLPCIFKVFDVLLSLMVCLPYFIVYLLVVNIDLHLKLQGLRLPLSLGPINKSLLPHGYPMLEIVYVSQVCYVATTMLSVL